MGSGAGAGAAGRPTVAHILPFPAVGGTEIATLRVMIAAREHGYESLAFCRADADPVRTLFDSAGFETIGFTAAEPSYRSPARYLASSFRLARAFRRRRVALVHAADVLGATLGGYAAVAARAPLICHVRNRYADLSLRDRSFLLPVSRFVFVSHDTWRHFAGSVPPHRGTVLYDGIDVATSAKARPADPDARGELGVPADAPVIGMVARVAPQKDYPTLVEAARLVHARFPDAYFVVVGDHASTEPLRQHYAEVCRLIEAAGLEGRFRFTGFRSDVQRCLRAFDIFVLSTHWEGLPLVLLEAMAESKPVVATAVDGIPELVEHGRSGLLYAHGDARALADQLSGLLADRAGLAAMGRAARARVAASFSRAAFAANVGQIYADTLKRGGVDPAVSPGSRRTAPPAPAGAAVLRSPALRRTGSDAS